MKRLEVLALIVILGLAAAYRMPGLSWGSGFEPLFHPDEFICTRALPGGSDWMDKAPAWYARGIIVQCHVLGRILNLPPDLKLADATRIARGYAFVCGLLGVLVIGLLGRALGGSRAGLLSAFMVATGGLHLVTSFWGRGQVQNSLAFFVSVLCVIYATRRRVLFWLFWAAFAAGWAIALRWSVALLPMLALAAITRERPLRSLIVVGMGVPVGVVVSTGFQWSPGQIKFFIESMSGILVTLEGRASWPVIAVAGMLATVAGSGLAAFGLAFWMIVEQSGVALARARDWLRERPAWPEIRDALGSPWILFWTPIAAQTFLVSMVKLFEDRFVDLLTIGLAVAAGVQLSAKLERTSRRGLAAAGLAVLVMYQGIYASGMMQRYSNDSRLAMDAELTRLLPEGAKLYVGRYIPPTPTLERFRVLAIEELDQASYALVSDIHWKRYRSLTPFVASGPPESCDYVYHCEGDEVLSFYKALDDPARSELLHREPAATWTPEVRLRSALMGSPWLFVGDTWLYRIRERD